jgi:hyaluronan synthase
MSRKNGPLAWLVAFLTFGSIFGILLLYLSVSRNSILGLYAISTTGFLSFMYIATAGYKPEMDAGFRPEITVVIPAKNEAEAVESVIRTVFNSDYPSSRMQVIAVDDGSTDRTWEAMQRAKTDLGFSSRLELIRHKRNYGKRAALASAIARAQGEIVVCIDSDSFVDRDAIRLLVQPFNNTKVMAVSGHGEAVNKDEGLLPRLQQYWYAEMFRLVKGMESRFGCVSCCSGMLAAYRRVAILPIVNEWEKERAKKAIGIPPIEMVGEKRETWVAHGLASKLIKSPGEDRILTVFALSGKGAKVVYQSNAIVRTVVPVSLRQFLKQQLRWTRGWIHGAVLSWRFMWRKPFPASIFSYLLQFLIILSPAIVVLWLFVLPLRGEWMGTAGFLAGSIFVGFLHGLNTWKYQGTPIESVPYRMLFGFVSLFLTLTILLYGLVTPWKGGWLTRAGATSQAPSIAPENALLETVAQ